MSDAITTVETAADLENVPGRDQEAVATLLSSGAPAVVWIEKWLADEKDLEPAENHSQVIVGHVDDYSDKAFHVLQPGRDADEFVPKSASHAFVLADATDAVKTPQAGLADFER